VAGAVACLQLTPAPDPTRRPAIAPTILALPLEGGAEGAAVRLHPLVSGEMQIRPWLGELREGPAAALRELLTFLQPKTTWLPVPVYLVEHPVAGPILVETGLDPSAASDPAKTMGRLFGSVLFSYRLAKRTVREQLADRGIDPDAIRTVVMTHLHTDDHAGGVGQFPGGDFIVDRREWEVATARRSILKGYYRPVLARSGRWKLADYATAQPYGAFARTLDLFGDGSVRLLSTPGHSAGHQSVLLRLQSREALLYVDAAHYERQLREELTFPMAHSKRTHRETLAEIHRFVVEHPNALVIPGHDPRVWSQLEPVYE